MAKTCLEYKLHRNEKGNLTTPSWMSDGGYYQNPTDKTMIGFVPSESERDWYVPDSAVSLSEAEFISRGMALHAVNTFQKMDDMDMSPMTDAEATTMLRTFYQSKVAE